MAENRQKYQKIKKVIGILHRNTICLVLSILAPFQYDFTIWSFLVMKCWDKRVLQLL